MSDLIVEVSEISSVEPHPNADRLELATIKGWQTVVPRYTYKTGDIVVYVPVNACMPVELSDALGVTQYLSSRGRVKATRLRGEVSYGLIFRIDSLPAEMKGLVRDRWVGDDVAEVLGITKYEPPQQNWEKGVSIGCKEAHPLFHKYTNINNIKSFPDILDSELVVITEKIHGTNSRLGLIRDDDGTMTFVAGSHNTQHIRERGGLYWDPMTSDLEKVLETLMSRVGGSGAASVIIYGEIYGPGIQDLTYGVTAPQWRAFDIAVNGAYLDFEQQQEFLAQGGMVKPGQLPAVPLLCDQPMPFTKERIADLTGGKTALDGGGLREGIVIKPVVERTHRKCGRVILKSISDEYMLRKDGTESK